LLQKLSELYKLRQTGQQGRRAGSVDVPALAANIFAAATDRTDNTKQGRLADRAGGLDQLVCTL